MWEVPVYPRKHVDWPKEVFVRWASTWISVFSALHFLGVVTATLFEVRRSHHSQDLTAQPFTSIDAMQISVFVSFVDAVAATLSVLFLWIYGRRRGRLGFRCSALLIFVLVGFPVQACMSTSILDIEWLAVVAIMVVAVRRPRRANRSLPERSEARDLLSVRNSSRTSGNPSGSPMGKRR